MADEYKEKLPYSNGELIVAKDSWKISYYFSPTDLRYNGIFFSIQGNKIDLYIDAYRKNWNRYAELKKAHHGMSGEIKIIGELNMSIYIGGYLNGIRVSCYPTPIDSEVNLNNVIDSFVWAKKRAIDVMRTLRQVY